MALGAGVAGLTLLELLTTAASAHAAPVPLHNSLSGKLALGQRYIIYVCTDLQGLHAIMWAASRQQARPEGSTQGIWVCYLVWALL